MFTAPTPVCCSSHLPLPPPRALLPPHTRAGSLKNLVACDVLWSDPVNDPGIRVNEARGCGTVFGPDVTAEFLSANGLRLIVRSHEGPDARDKRLEGDKMPSVDSGYAEDHVTDSKGPCCLSAHAHRSDTPVFLRSGLLQAAVGVVWAACLQQQGWVCRRVCSLTD